ncbi:OmpA family protein [Treponema sp.]|uniref:OmpA family protein n=1 Tax=Treponema sp. TaxID=166 RepID=UPI0038911940
MNKKILKSLLIYIVLIHPAVFSQNYIETYDVADFMDKPYIPQHYVPYADEELEREAEMVAAANGHASRENATTTSSSFVNWTKNSFISDVSLDVEKAGIPMPSGKSTSVKRIEMDLPILIKDPLLSLNVDDSKTLNDLVLDGTITLENITRIVDKSHKTPSVFAEGGSTLLTKHDIDLRNISSSLVKHTKPYTQPQPIDSIASRKYTGIVIDARGTKPVQGEFSSSRVYPCLFPKIWNEDMDLVYEKNMVVPETAKKEGMVHYSSSDLIEDYNGRVGKDPLWISAKKVYGINRCDPVISKEDYLRIASVKENLDLLKNGKIVLLLDKDLLEHKVSVPNKDRNYYITYHRLMRYFIEKKIPDIGLADIKTGIQITVDNLRFVADSAELLESEKHRISTIAETLKKETADGDYSILVEGHTADVNKPNGQMNLSIERAQSIVNALVDSGLNKRLFTFKGYGGTKPAASNSTAEGRAKNRRVEIIILPKDSYLMTK